MRPIRSVARPYGTFAFPSADCVVGGWIVLSSSFCRRQRTKRERTMDAAAYGAPTVPDVPIDDFLSLENVDFLQNELDLQGSAGIPPTCRPLDQTADVSMHGRLNAFENFGNLPRNPIGENAGVSGDCGIFTGDNNQCQNPASWSWQRKQGGSSSEEAGGTGDAILRKKRQETLEKNRRNQKKFRERQKAKMQTLEHKVELLTAQVQRLKVENSSLLSQNDMLSKVVEIKEGQIRVLREGVDGEESGNVGKPRLCALRKRTEICEHSRFYTADMVMKMSADDIRQKYRDFCHQLSEILGTIELKGSQPELEVRIDQIVLEMAELLSKVVAFQPLVGARLAYSNFDSNSGLCDKPMEQDAEHRRETLLRTFAFTKEQRETIVAHYRQLQSTLAKVRSRQTLLNTKLQDYLTVQTGLESTTHALAEGSVQADDLAKELKNTISEEREAYGNFIAVFWGDVCSTKQVARACVHAYPFYPDVMGSIRLLVSVEEEASQCGGPSPQ